MSALNGLTVVELGEFVSAAYCTKLLADLGAEVIKVEPPDGGAMRRVGPFPPGVAPQSADALEWSATQLYFDANKTGKTADIRTAAGRDSVASLLLSADVIVTDMETPSLSDALLDHDTVRERNPNLVYASIRPFGSWGPYSKWKAYGLNAEATGGGCTIGDPDREPLRHPWNQVHIQSGAHAAAAILASVLSSDRPGQWIDISEADIWAYHIGGGAINTWVFHGRARRRSGRRTPNPYPSGAVECQDGLISEAAIRGSEWKRFLLVIGDGEIPDWARDSKYSDRRRNSIEYADELDELQRPWLQSHTREEIFELARRNRLPFAPVYSLDEVVGHPHLNVRDFFVALPIPDGETVQAPGAPYKLSATPWKLKSGAPRLSGDDSPTCRQHRTQREDDPRPREAAPRANAATPGPPPAASEERRLPLAGLRVLDMSAVIAGPQCGRMLADMGAEVVKVESRAHPDAMRTSANNVDGNPEHDSMFHFMNRNKRGITLNISTLKGRELFLQLVEQSDIVVENFAPRMIPGRGLDYRTLSQRNRKIILVSMPGAGDTGPLRDMVSYASNINAVSGLDSLAGYPGEGPITVAGAYCDWNSAVHACIAVLAAVRARRRTGYGQYINVSQWEAAVAGLGPAVLQYTLGGPVPGPVGNRDIYHAPHGIYPTAGADQWIAIVCGSESEWLSLRRAMGDPSWATESDLQTREGRLQKQDKLDSELAKWTRDQDRDQLVAKLQDCGVAASPVLEVGERWSDPHFAARDGFVQVEHPTMGVLVAGGAPWKFSETPVDAASHGPFLGQDNQVVYGDWLGMSEQEIASLVADKVIY